MNNYELHITVPLSEQNVSTMIAEELKWKTSIIKGDIELGKESLFYLTRHDSDILKAYDSMDKMVSKLLEYSVGILRTKVEHIVYDNRLHADNPTAHNICMRCVNFKNTPNGPFCNKFNKGLFYATLECGMLRTGYRKK